MPVFSASNTRQESAKSIGKSLYLEVNSFILVKSDCWISKTWTPPWTAHSKKSSCAFLLKSRRCRTSVIDAIVVISWHLLFLINSTVFWWYLSEESNKAIKGPLLISANIYSLLWDIKIKNRRDNKSFLRTRFILRWTPRWANFTKLDNVPRLSYNM